MCCGQLLATRTVAGVSKDDSAVHTALEPSPKSARTARRFIRDHVPDLTADQEETLLLLTSELVTNGVLHARTELELGMVSGAEVLLVTVADDNSEVPEVPPIDYDRPSGRGLMLLGGLATEWGVQERGGGKTVWFTIALSPKLRAGAAHG